ncbi:DNA-directed RNA polymerase I and III subunit RPAC2 [Kwoniella mangroviensis CBS 10435]|uniref:DNA-directed RNA polymerases I and III subunit RPAC2 n=1 Tax=Kwoniella mangroviensis CBS 10435 TaxID=1331196 RepID=A0A1B9IHT1_9TREE|nr:DNA-directed RNA polymerase I and III subunit RPAC2 [Kwoniella mangroviensis CBS 8507]OCF55249.1 DNA-directed RNA polymerase I and III subunit RPAC2 [Kwoniella mangroviensis CBS 10435]OCF65901.1 DNA-directed RNA polymerase I and III subunit RPAC2 [Kwoniella mangroviensis CBS 8507]
MADEAPQQSTSKLDNAGTLLQSVSTSMVHEKVSILPGHEPDYSACTFCLWQEDHTLGNALRWIIMKDPDVEFCGYTAPHPSEPKIHLRIQMYDGLSAVDCLRKALSNLRDLFSTIDKSYKTSLRNDNYIKENDIDVRAAVDETLRQRGFPVEGDDEGMDLS